MSDSKPDDEPRPAPTPSRESRSIEASLKLSQLLARPLGTPAPPGWSAPEPSVPRVERLAEAKPPEAPADQPAHSTASVPAPPAAAEPPVDVAPAPGFLASDPAEPAMPSAPAPHQDPTEPQEPPEQLAEVWPRPRRRRLDESAEGPAVRPAPLDEVFEPPAPAAAALAPEPVRRPSEPPPAGKPLDPAAASALAKIRRLMLISNLFMLLAIAAVLGVVGYRVYHIEPAPPPAPPPAPVAAPAPTPPPVPEMTLTLPRDARIVQTAVSGDRLVITLEINGAIEIRTYDLKTLKPAGRLSFGGVP